MKLFGLLVALVAAAAVLFPLEAAARIAGNHNETLVR